MSSYPVVLIIFISSAKHPTILSFSSMLMSDIVITKSIEANTVPCITDKTPSSSDIVLVATTLNFLFFRISLIHFSNLHLVIVLQEHYVETLG